VADLFELHTGAVRDVTGRVWHTVDIDGDDVARGPDAVTLLDNTDTRNKIVDELMEV